MVHERSIGGMASDMKKEKHLQKNLFHLEFPGVKFAIP
jgi:hypothetical protein